MILLLRRLMGCFVAISMAWGCIAQLHGATLSGYLRPVTNGTIVNLTAAGPIDWAQWGLNASNQFNDKAGAGKISNVSTIGPNASVQYSTNSVGFSWSNGQPIAVVTNTTTGLLVVGQGNGFALSAPADTTPQRLRVYLGVNTSQGSFSATLSDASAAGFSDMSVDSAGPGHSNAVYTVNYAAGSAGQTLQIQFTALTVYATNGCVSLQATVLATDSPPAITLTQPASNSVFAVGQSISLQATASDTDGTIGLVEFFADGSLLGNSTASPYSFTWANAPLGTHVLTAAATDNDGGRTVSSAVSVLVDAPPSVAITNPASLSDFFSTNDLLISATASDDGTVTNVTFLADGSSLGKSTTPPFSQLWRRPPPGIHSLTALASDNNGLTTLSIPVTVFVFTNGGTLAPSVSGVPSGSVVDLSGEGTNDWAHWGLYTQDSFNHKRGVPQLISNYSPIGAGPGEFYQFADNANGYSWSDGSPTSSASNTTTGIYVVGVGTGFALSAPAGTNLSTLRLYVGAYAAQGQLLAYVSDFSAPPYLDASLNNSANGPGVVYTLNYSAASPGQTLVMQYTEAARYDPFGNVTLQAATLSTGNDPPTAILISPTNYARFSSPATIPISAAASDLDGSVRKVEFFQGATNKLGQVTNSPYTFSWSNVLAGTYVLTAKATDDGGLSFTSSPFTIFVTSNGGFVLGALAAPPSSVNLTEEGQDDWTHWGVVSIGHGPPSSFDHKTNGLAQISDATNLGASAFQIYNDNPSDFLWTDGTPTLSADTTTGYYKTNLSEGFLITAPADSTLRRLKVYVGVFYAQGRLEATLSDYSSPPFIDTSIGSFGPETGVYTLSYSAPGPGRKLTVKYTSNALFDEANGNVTLQAATLVALKLSVLTPPDPNHFSFSFPTDSGLSYSVQFRSSFGAANWQTLTNVTGTGAPMIITDPIVPKRFYRVKLGN